MSKSHLLINEPSLQVLPSLAKAIGLNEAIVLQQLHYWLNNPKVGVERNGYKWIFNTYEDWVENFPFWSASTIKRAFTSLEEQGVVISEQLDAKQRDMTKYYRIDYAALDLLEQVKLNSSIGSKRADVNNESETTTETNKGRVSIPQNMPVEWYIEHDLPIPEDLAEQNRLVADATNEFESALGFGQLPWDSVTGWQTFKKWVVKIYQTDPQTFRKYAEWRLQKGKFTAMSNKQIRQSPAQFMDTGYPEFLAHSAMYNGGGNAPKPL